MYVWCGMVRLSKSAVQPNFQRLFRRDLFSSSFPSSHSYCFGHQQYQQTLRSPRRRRRQAYTAPAARRGIGHCHTHTCRTGQRTGDTK
ncbi:hypothetical protein CGRA01v4_14107 [Colletotrichum graminicola]|nr:hypothetical protein CGRA01v4_14107 [Colletotrichum graminicola]